MVTSAAPKKASLDDWHQADITAALHKAGWTISALGLANGMSRSTLANAYSKSYPKAERIIAEAIGVPVQNVWPSRWNEDGTPKPRGIRAMQFSARERAAKKLAATA